MRKQQEISGIFSGSDRHYDIKRKLGRNLRLLPRSTRPSCDGERNGGSTVEMSHAVVVVAAKFEKSSVRDVIHAIRRRG